MQWLLVPDFRVLNDYVRSSVRIACETISAFLPGAIRGALISFRDVIENLIKGLRRLCHNAIKAGIAIDEEHVSRARPPGSDQGLSFGPQGENRSRICFGNPVKILKMYLVYQFAVPVKSKMPGINDGDLSRC